MLKIVAILDASQVVRNPFLFSFFTSFSTFGTLFTLKLGGGIEADEWCANTQRVSEKVFFVAGPFSVESARQRR